MARIRTIKPKYWDDFKIGRISRDARLTYIGLWNFADDLGTVLADPNWIKSKIFPYDNLEPFELTGWLTELAANGFLSPFEHTGIAYYHIKKLLEHQLINRPNLDELFVPATVVKSIHDQSLINHGSITDQSRNDHGSVTEPSLNDHGTITDQSVLGGVYIQDVRYIQEEEEEEYEEKEKEKKNEKEKEGRVIALARETAANQKNLIFDAEQEILGNQKRFEKIMIASRTLDEHAARDSLHKYHLWLVDKDQYPKAKNQCYAGFERWLLNEKKFSNGTPQRTSSRNDKSAGATTLANRVIAAASGRKGDFGA